MAGGHFRTAFEITLKRGEMREGRVTKRNIVFISKVRRREAGLWSFLTAWGSPLDSDPTAGEELRPAEAGLTQTH